MKKRNKVVKILLLIGGIFALKQTKVSALEETNCYKINNNDICISETEYNNLSNLGFSDIEIMNLDQDEFDMNKDIVAHVDSQTTQYYRSIYVYDRNHQLVDMDQELISETEYNNSNLLEYGFYANPSTSIEIVDRKLTTMIITNNNMHRYKVTLTWKDNPSERYYDIIGIGMQSDRVYYSGNRVFRQVYCVTEDSCTSDATATFTTQSAGIGASFELESGNFDIFYSYLYFDINKRVPQVTWLKAAGDYKHAIEETDLIDSGEFNINLNGINLFDEVINKYDSIPTADANWTGTW